MKKSCHALCLFTALLLSGKFHAYAGNGAVISLGDLNTTTISRQAVGPGASASSVSFFAAADSEHGTEVWRYDGSSATLFRDARPGPESGNPSQFTTVGSYVVYVADDGIHGPELFTTANNATGLLADVQPGSTHAAPTILGASNGYLWFTTSATTSGSQRPVTEVWVTNGASAPVRKGVFAENSITSVSVLPTGPGTTRPALFFIARTYGTPTGFLDLWCAQGSGSVVAIDHLRSSSSVPVPATPVYAATNGFVCYQLIEGNSEPYLYDLSSSTKSTLAVINGYFSQPTNFVSNGTDTISFAATSADAGREVWITRGSTATTSLLADVTAGTASSNPSVLMMSRGNPGVFFQVVSGGHRDLYFADPGANPVFKKYDSSVEDTAQHTVVAAREIAYVKPAAAQWQVKFADGVSGTAVNLGAPFTSVARMWNSSSATPMGSSLYLVGTTSANGEELYGRFGASLQPIFLANSPASDSARPRAFFPFGSSEQLFVADTSSVKGQLYRLDSGSANPVTQATPSDVFSSNPSSLPAEFTEVNGSLFFTAYDGHDRRLFLSANGTLDSAAPLSGIYDPEQLVAFQNGLFLLGRATAGGTGLKQLFQVTVDSGNACALLVNSPAGYNATALKAAAGQLFFVEPHESTIERLNCLDSAFSVTVVCPFYKDTAGVGITQLTASSGHLYFTALEGSQPTNKRVAWGTDGTAGSLSQPTTTITNPQLLGTLGDACILWNDPGNNSTYDAWAWTAGSGPPTEFYRGPFYDLPEKHRVSGKPAGIEANGRFYFTTQSGRLMETNGTALLSSLSTGGLIRPESLCALPDKLVLMSTSPSNNLQLFSVSPVNGDAALNLVWSTSNGSLPSPLLPLGGRLYFTVSNLYDNLGRTELWRTDGTSVEQILNDLVWREVSNVPMGAYRGHLVLAAQSTSGYSGMEPALLNHVPVIPAVLPLTGARRNQPFTFTYGQIIQAPATDADGDTLTPLRLFKTSGVLKRNGTDVEISTDIAPGDEFVWIPDSGKSGPLIPFMLSTTDGWKEMQQPVFIEVKAPHDLWSEVHFTPEELQDPSISAADSDPNGNGLSNAMEFLFDRDPKAPNFAPGWKPSLITPAGGGAPLMRFSFTHAAVLAEGTLLQVECSPDLTPGSWNAIATKTENAAWNSSATVTETTLSDGRIQVHVDLPKSDENVFFRLKADL